jgi:hypothetical protein
VEFASQARPDPPAIQCIYWVTSPLRERSVTDGVSFVAKVWRLPESREVFVFVLRVLVLAVDNMINHISSPVAVHVHHQCLRPATFRDRHRDVDDHLLLDHLFPPFHFPRIEHVRRAAPWVEQKLTLHLDVLEPLAPREQHLQVAVALHLERLRRRLVVFLQSSATKPLEAPTPLKPNAVITQCLNPTTPANPPQPIANLVSPLHPLNLRTQIRRPLPRRPRAPPSPRSHRSRPRCERWGEEGLHEARTPPPQRHGDQPLIN